jgi:biofilm PGA synthesis protein PgaA
LSFSPRNSILAVLAAAVAPALSMADESAAAYHYDSLVEQARAGQHTPALVYLRGLERPSRQQMIDHVLIASWAGRDQEVLRLVAGASAGVQDDPAVLAAQARAQRNLQQWPAALDSYRTLLVSFPQRDDWRLAYIMTLADAGDQVSALQQAETWANQANSADARLAFAYALMRAGKPYAALHEVDAAVALAPNRADVQQEYFGALQRAGLPLSALTLAGASPGLVDEAFVRRLQGDRLAELVRLAELEAREEANRFVVADRAVLFADELIGQWQSRPEAEADLMRVRIDRLGALFARVRMPELVAEYRDLQGLGVELPVYALRWVAGALLYLREPGESAALYRRVIDASSDKDPDWIADHQGLYYALVESEARRSAHDLAIGLAAAQPARVYPAGIAAGVPNSAWEEAQSLLASSHLFMDDTAAAQAALEELSDAAPNNSWLRANRASLYEARGWPRRSEQELKVAESTQPHSLAVISGQGATAYALQEWRQLDLLADAAVSRHPENLAARRLDRLRRIHHMAELQVSGYRGGSEGSDVQASSDFGIETTYRSEPINHDWRGVAGLGHGQGKFIEGRGTHTWLRAGLDRRVRDHSLEAEISSHEYGHGQKLGARLSASWDMDDQWRYGATAERLSASTPLRALNSNVDADGASVYLRWRANERREWEGSLASLWFSDGNDRSVITLNGRERLHTTPTTTLDLGIGASSSRNSRGGEGFYFNPARDASGITTLTFTQVLHRRYETQWTHALQLGGGLYEQRDFGSSGIALLGYSHRVRLTDRFTTGAGVSLLNRQYDGQREKEYRLVFDMQYRF